MSLFTKVEWKKELFFANQLMKVNKVRMGEDSNAAHAQVEYAKADDGWRCDSVLVS